MGDVPGLDPLPEPQHLRRAPPSPPRPAGAPAIALDLVLGLVVLASVGTGALTRAYLLWHQPLFGDEAVAGLAARQINASQLHTFYPGQQYGGVELYVDALFLRIKDSPLVLNAVPVVLSLVCALLIAWAAWLLTSRWRLAALAGALVWVWPYGLEYNATRELGFRFATLTAGLVVLVAALAIFRRGASVPRALALGLGAGLGWWASPEILYFALPVALILLGAWSRPFDRAATRPVTWFSSAVAVLGAVVGAAPWLYTNVRNHFLSLRHAAYPATAGLDYVQRLQVFGREMLPIQLGARGVPGDQWVGGTTTGHVVVAVALALVAGALVVAVLCARRGRRALPLAGLAAGTVAFPFLYAVIPGSGYYVDGRYGLYLPALVVLLLVGALGAITEPGGPGRSRVAVSLGAVACVVVLVGAGALGWADALESGGLPRTDAGFSHWADPNAADRAALQGLSRAGITRAYAGYWAAYDLDFLAPAGTVISPSGLDVVRFSSLERTVARSADPAWLFDAPGETARATAAFSNPEPGPGGLTEHQFEGRLTTLHVGFRVVHLGIVDAVVPAHRISATQVAQARG